MPDSDLWCPQVCTCEHAPSHMQTPRGACTSYHPSPQMKCNKNKEVLIRGSFGIF